MHSEIVFGRQSRVDAASERTGTMISCPINTNDFAVDDMIQLLQLVVAVVVFVMCDACKRFQSERYALRLTRLRIVNFVHCLSTLTPNFVNQPVLTDNVENLQILFCHQVCPNKTGSFFQNKTGGSVLTIDFSP